MIIKSLSRKAANGSTGQLVNYICRYVVNEQKLVNPDKPFLVKYNIHGQSLAEFVRQFEANEAGRIHKRSDQISLQHTILSWHKDDAQHVTDAMLKDIIAEYVRLRGDNNIFLFSKHEDKSHIHLHGVVSATQLNGKSSRMSQREFAHLKVALQEYQKQHYPELTHSLPNHGLAKENRELATEQITGKPHYHQAQKETLRQVYENAKLTAYSHDDVVQQFINLGHTPYYREGKLQGFAYDGETKYRLTNLGIPPIELLTEIAHNEINEIAQLEELRALRERTHEKEQELHTREFLFDLYEQSIERELASYGEQGLLIEPEEETGLDDFSEPHVD